MERAGELEPVDPVVNDHLGDVMWSVARYNEARFQWRRALSFVKDDNVLSIPLRYELTLPFKVPGELAPILLA